VERLPHGRHVKAGTRGAQGRRRPHRRLAQLATLAGAISLVSIALPSAVGNAAPAATPTGSLKAVAAKAERLSNEIDVLGQQYDGLRIQLSEARSEVKVAKESYLRDKKLLAAEQNAVAAIAAEGYETGGVDPTLQLLQSGDPQSFLNKASIMVQLQQENGSKLNAVALASANALRAKATAIQQESLAAELSAKLTRKVAVIQAKENVLNSAAYAKALSIYEQTGTYPTAELTGNSVGVQALKWALSRIGDPYVWGAAGPNEFDCSGLVMWAYAHVGISLEHFTGDQWNEGVHVPRSELKPGDLIFFFSTISHVGMYIGKGMMVDAPTQGQDVQIQAVYWGSVVGYVHIG
jgi:cell wall-associated NlpC family hydrolase